jgi:hypothetical protein
MKRRTIYAATKTAKNNLEAYKVKKAKKCKAGCGCVVKSAQVVPLAVATTKEK